MLKTKIKIQLFLPLLIVLFGCQSANVKSNAGQPGLRIAEAVNRTRETAEARGRRYAISTQGIYASQAAQKIFEMGGNIIDAAVSASFVISVERPQSTGIGGGGFFLFHEQKTGRDYAIDFRERAPLAAYEKMYLDPKGEPNSDLSQDGIRAVAVPGLIAGLIEVHSRFGRLSLKQVIAPAIDLAENGFAVYPYLFKSLAERAEILRRDPGARKIFLNSAGEPWPVGYQLKQRDLARSLRLIAEKGRDVFYRGEIAQKIVKFSKEQKGLLSMQDFNQYQVKWREPVRGNYRDFQVVSMPPPSSGGVHVVQILKFLEDDNLSNFGVHSPTAIHLEASAMQAAFADRAKYLGDPDFVKVPLKTLVAKSYLVEKRQQVNLDRARNLAEVKAGVAQEPDETTHLSILDDQGNAVSTTQTINGWMGAAIVVPGTGILLNNEMDDFSAKPMASNMFGAVGSVANRIEPAKTPLSSMSPTFLIQNGEVKLSLGAPGGTRIITCVAQTLINYIDFGLPLWESIAAVRVHHQWSPDELQIESPGPTPEAIGRLEKMGYKIKIGKVPCHLMAVAKEGSEFHAVADPRDIGTAAAR